MLSALAFVLPWFGKLVKGTASVVVQDGVMQTGPMRRLLVTHDDLRLQASVDDTAIVQVTRLERSGQLSVITAKTGPTVQELRSKPACRLFG
ncbi:YetF domain-containing protein [Deinococcus malanensis]|nr:YetF domain-containing protein [Deinococcus malanensis]